MDVVFAAGSHPGGADELSNNHLSIFSAVICLSCPMVVNSAHTIGSWSLRTEQRRRAF